MVGKHPFFPVSKATPLRWKLRASADLLPQSCSMKNGKYIQYSRIFHTFARVKTLAESPCPIMRCCPKKYARSAGKQSGHLHKNAMI